MARRNQRKDQRSLAPVSSRSPAPSPSAGPLRAAKLAEREITLLARRPRLFVRPLALRFFQVPFNATISSIKQAELFITPGLLGR
jgi:hypothetical protein